MSMDNRLARFDEEVIDSGVISFDFNILKIL